MRRSSQPRRQLRLIDLMVVILVAGIAIWMTTSYLRCFSVLFELVSTEPPNVRAMGLREWLYACVPALILLSGTLWPLRIGRRGERFRRIARLPGLTVSYAAWVALLLALARSAFDLRSELKNTYFPDIGLLAMGDVLALRVVALKDMMGSAVAVTWLLLWRAGLWRAEPSWIDRLGRLLGVFWIVLGLALWVDHIVRP